MKLYNSFTRELEEFKPIDPEGKHVGMYVCGPTVYNEAHMGNCRTFVTFDIIYRYLLYKGYKVRYVRNITDVGHLVGDVDEGAESKVEKRARLEQLEPMEIVQKYTNLFHDVMRVLNTLPPSIEPTATGHIVEQIEMVKAILDNGYAYIKNGSVYFDTQKLIKENRGYGQLSGKLVEDLLTETRDNLKNQDEKEHPSDFAIWVKAAENHLMHWPSPWSEGFPGWHLECSAMSTKYLGKTFDIHGGGMDLQFPHHENEIAQNLGACGCHPVNYWLHGNMLLLNGRKMSKSDDNSIMPGELFEGTSPLMTKAYSPMTLRFFMLQAHYRSTLNITDDALQAAEKGLQRLMNAYNKLIETNENKLHSQLEDSTATVNTEIEQLLKNAENEMEEDFNTPNALASFFNVTRLINDDSYLHLKPSIFNKLKSIFHTFVFDIFGLSDESKSGGNDGNAEIIEGLMQMVINYRKEVREAKEWAKSDAIRDQLLAIGIQIKDGKEGASWSKV